MQCNQCDNQVEQPRVDLGLTICKECAFKNPTKKLKGIPSFAEDSIIDIEIVHPEEFIGNRSLVKDIDNPDESEE